MMSPSETYFSTTNPIVMRHVIISMNPFIVKFFNDNGSEKVVRYEVPLTNAEIKAEYDYIVFDQDCPTFYYQIWLCDEPQLSVNAKTTGVQRTLIGIIEARNVEHAFKMSQNDFNGYYRMFGKRSTMVGDMIVDMSDGQGYIINGHGFKVAGKILQTADNLN
jgi:hypothetical protein